MDETKLLEECIHLTLTPLQTLLLSETLISTNEILVFLMENKCMEIARVEKDGSLANEQTGDILIKSAIENIKEMRKKIWESGKDVIGEIIPEEFSSIMMLYTTILEAINYQFIKSLPIKER